MKIAITLILGALGFAGASLAQQNTELNATCNDGAHYSGATRQNACADHGGVQKWIESTTVAGPNEATVVGTSGKNSQPPAPVYQEPGPSKTTGPSGAAGNK